MAIANKFCGRRFRHKPHDWKEPSLSVGYDFWPEFHCHGITEGPTEQQYLQGARPAMAVNTEESADDAMQRYARQIEKIKDFINDPDNYIAKGFITGDEEIDGVALVKVEDIKKILGEEE